MNDLKKIHIYVDRDSWDRFLEFVREKHGKVKGVLWIELKKAIEEYMGTYAGSVERDAMYLKYGIQKSKTLRIVDGIAMAVMDTFKEGKTVSFQWVEEWIRLNISPIPGTVAKYANFFKQIYVWDTWDNKYIKPWTFRRKDGKPMWKSEDDYLKWLHDHGISSTWIQSKMEEERKEIENLLNAEAAD